MDQDSAKTFCRYITLSLLGLIVWIASTATLAVLHARSFLLQRGAIAYLVELATILAIYTAGVLFLARQKPVPWNASQRATLTFGLFSALVETASIVLENMAPQLFKYAPVSISLMLIMFLLWGGAAVWTYALSASWKSGVAAAVGSAGICMLIGVAVGFPIELFLRPPDPSVVTLWCEYQRSGWSNARLFALANTLDSASMHLMLAPIVACVFGAAGLLVRRIFVKVSAKERTLGSTEKSRSRQ